MWQARKFKKNVGLIFLSSKNKNFATVVQIFGNHANARGHSKTAMGRVQSLWITEAKNCISQSEDITLSGRLQFPNGGSKMGPGSIWTLAVFCKSTLIRRCNGAMVYWDLCAVNQSKCWGYQTHGKGNRSPPQFVPAANWYQHASCSLFKQISEVGTISNLTRTANKSDISRAKNQCLRFLAKSKCEEKVLRKSARRSDGPSVRMLV